MNLLVRDQRAARQNLSFGLKILHGAGCFAKGSGSYTCSAPCLAVFGETVIVTC